VATGVVLAVVGAADGAVAAAVVVAPLVAVVLATVVLPAAGADVVPGGAVVPVAVGVAPFEPASAVVVGITVDFPPNFFALFQSTSSAALPANSGSISESSTFTAPRPCAAAALMPAATLDVFPSSCGDW
jgi:hypothetical protein